MSALEPLPLTRRQPVADDLHGLSPVQVVDLLLWSLMEHRGGGFVVEATREGHVLSRDFGPELELLVPSELGDAIVARLALIADVPLDLRHGVVRKVRLGSRPGAVASHFRAALVAIRATRSGLCGEVHLLPEGGRSVAGAAVPNDDGTPALAKYKLGRELGRGGMGVVWEAEHVALQKPVAIKMLQQQFAERESIAEQFLIEARAACRARHLGIVDVTDFGHDAAGRAYIVMERVTWPTLEERLRDGPFDLVRALRIAGRIAQALAAAADQGVVHRDLKPGNVFVGDGDEVKIGDFGLAVIASRTDDGSARRPLEHLVIGTAHYMAPEQARGEAVDERADLYSLGCVLHEMITWGPPYTEMQLREMLGAGEVVTPPAVVSREGPVPEQVQAVIHRAIAPVASERFQTAAEMAIALREVQRTLGRDDWRRWLSR